MRPAAWPALVMAAGFVMATRPFAPTTLLAVCAEMAAACAVYAFVFVFFGIGTEQRRCYLSKAQELLQRRAPVPIAEGA